MTELKADNTFVFGEECLAYKKSEADKVIAHHKYKRCLAMARWCASRSDSWCLDPADEQLHKSDFYDKWKKRWLELAEQFKEARR